ncbi:MAG: hypothetical protein ACJ790_04120 [Myxococcaceae bacterium]
MTLLPLVATLMLGASAKAPHPEVTHWSMVSAGSVHTCAIAEDHGLWCWGHGSQGRLGLGDAEIRTRPTRVGTRRDWTWISAGDNHTCGIAGKGELYCWGYGSGGRVVR